MHILQAFDQLVDDVPLVDVLQDVGPNHGVEICVHIIEYQVNVSVILCPDDVQQSDNVVMSIQLLEEDNLPECTLGISGILKGIKILFESNYFLCFFIDCLPHNSVGSFS